MPANVCRVCLNQEFLVSIFKKTGFLMISTKLMSIAKVHITPEDGLPDTICSKCVQNLDKCIEFIELCESSEVKLKAMFLLENSCTQKELVKDNTNITIENDNFISDNDTLSPKSEAEKVLFIDESIDHSVINQTTLTDNHKENETIEDTTNKINSNISSKKNRKQQCNTCGKVMSSSVRAREVEAMEAGLCPGVRYNKM